MDTKLPDNGTTFEPAVIFAFDAEEFAEKAGNALTDLAEDYLPDDYKLTLVARYTGNQNLGDMTVGSDDLRLVTGCVANIMARQAVEQSMQPIVEVNADPGPAPYLPPKIEMVPAYESSQIASMGYSPEARVLRVLFKSSGGVYDYQDVPQEIYDGALAAESVGRFINTNVVKKFLHHKLV